MPRPSATMSPSERDRDALIESAIPYARMLAAKMSRELPSSVSFDELVAAANLGLVDAAQRFDPSRGAQFSTFAYYRIRGAILDHVHEHTWAMPQVRARLHAEAALDSLVEERLGPSVQAATRADAALELAELLGEMAVTCSLVEIAEITEPTRPKDPESNAVSNERRERLEAALSAIPPREATLLRAMYFGHQTLEQAGAAMGLSKSWTCRLHVKAVRSLKAQLERLEHDL